MKLAVVGAGVSGLTAAFLLSRQHRVTLFEANDYLGGHTHTHRIERDGQCHALDTGFLVFNRGNYPLLMRLFAELQVASQPSSMSFSVTSEASGREYCASSLAGLFCQRRNLVSPAFWGMLRDLVRFYRRAPAVLDCPGSGPTLAQYLSVHGYGAAFRDEHLVPMASALWSAPAQVVLDLPLRFLVKFLLNHQMLQLANRPQWRVVRGGSAAYIAAMRARWGVEERPGCPVHAVHRFGREVRIESAAGAESFDQVILACHSDQALALLADASERERQILGAIAYQRNEVLLHTDAAVLPRRRSAWAAWNAHVPRAAAAQPCSVSYCLNILQGIRSDTTFLVTLNRAAGVDPGKVLRRLTYHHPVYSQAALTAQARKWQIQGHRHTWFAGAYWGWGFHEDGVRSAVEIAQALGVHWPEDAAQTPARSQALGAAA